MKKALLPMAIAALLPAGAMAGGPIDGDVYGKIHMVLHNVDDSISGEDTTELSSEPEASRFGVKGKGQLSDDLYVIYKIEWEVDITDGKTEMDTRNRYVGLSGNFGTVLAGYHDTPHKLAQADVDLFNDLVGDIKNIVDSENRASNIVMYTSPTAAGFAISAAWIAAEDEDLDDGTSIALSYDMNGLYLAAAYETDVEGQDIDSTRLVAQYTVGAFQLGALWEENDVDGFDTEDAMHFSLAYKIDAWTLKTQYTQSEIRPSSIVSGIEGDEGEMWSYGADYKLGKNTKVFGYYTTQENDEDTYETDYLGVGIEHKF